MATLTAFPASRYCHQLAEMEHPRIDVTLRVSGLFRDVFPTLVDTFCEGYPHSWLLVMRMLTGIPYVKQQAPVGARVYGPAPGSYGLGLGATIEDVFRGNARTDGRRGVAGGQFLCARWRNGVSLDREGIRERVAGAECFRSSPGTCPRPIFCSASDYAAHQTGFAAAQSVTGGSSANYHVDNTDPDAPRARDCSREEIARVVYARATNPDWAAGMMRHGYPRRCRDGCDARTSRNAFAHLANVVEPHLFDRYYDATLGNDAVHAISSNEANPSRRLQAMEERFAALHAAGLWRTQKQFDIGRS